LLISFGVKQTIPKYWFDCATLLKGQSADSDVHDSAGRFGIAKRPGELEGRGKFQRWMLRSV